MEAGEGVKGGGNSEVKGRTGSEYDQNTLYEILQESVLEIFNCI